MQKKPFLLLEILIGLVLAGLLLTFVFRSIRNTAEMETRIAKITDHVMATQKIQARLQDVFLGIAHGGPAPRIFYTVRLPKEKKISVVFTFDQGIDPDPAFSGPVLGRIFWDEEGNLCLATWSFENEKAWRKEILATDAEDFCFSFFSCKQDPETGKGTTSWENFWDKDRPPSMIRLENPQCKAALHWGFLLPVEESVQFMAKEPF